MGGRGSSSNSLLTSLGLQRETEIDESLFNFFDIRFGSYARRLAQESNEFMDEGTMVVSLSKGENKAFAAIDTESDTLETIVSTGGGTGTELLSKALQYQKQKGRGLIWYADNPESIKYYDKLGLGKFGEGNSKQKLYTVDKANMGEAIKLVNKRVKK